MANELEVRYIVATGVVTGWCGDPDQFGNLGRGRDEEAIVYLNTGVPEKSIDHYRYDGLKLVDDLVAPAIVPTIKEELADLKARVEALEKP